MNYYNENDPKTAAWLRELIKARVIARGEVDERSIVDVAPTDLRGFRQCHFFAGIGGWSYALRLAGWPDHRPVWTGSCPCQPFSSAGKGLGEADPRHLWPFFRNLIGECRPAIVFGEQVASAAGREWLAGVRADLAQLVYRFGAADLCAAWVKAPMLRQRLYWMACADGGRTCNSRLQRSGRYLQQPQDEATGGLGHSARERWHARHDHADAAERSQRAARIGGTAHGLELTTCACARCRSGGLGDAAINGRFKGSQDAQGRQSESLLAGGTAWSSFDLIPCTDGKTRRVESGTFPLAHGVPGRVGLLRGYGNAIVPQLAAEFIRASVEALNR